MAGKGLKNKYSSCGALHGAGLYKQSLSLYVNVISIQTRATKLWTVAVAGQLLMAALKRGRGRQDRSHLILGPREEAVGRDLKRLR